VRVYQHAGYFPPAEMEELIARVSQAVVTEPSRLLATFVDRYG
jgi:GMP synthase (glutamine-hydrolysing)